MNTYLVAVDFWRPSLHALETAADLARRTQSRLVVVHVYDAHNHYPESMEVDHDTMAEDLEAALSRLLDPLRQSGLSIETDLREGNIRRQLQEALHQHHADALFLGFHEGRMLDDIFVGANTLQLVKHCEVPVMVVNHAHRNFVPQTVAIPFDIEEGVDGVIDLLEAGMLPGLQRAKLLIGLKPDQDEDAALAGPQAVADKLQALGIKDVELIVGSDTDPQAAIVDLLLVEVGTFDLVLLEMPDHNAKGEMTVGSLVEQVVSKGRMPVFCAPTAWQR